MITEQFIQSILQNSEQQLAIVNNLIRKGSHFYIFPFEIQGCVNITETGLKPEALNIRDYSYFSKVVRRNGDQSIVATWEKSTRWVGESKRYPFMQCELGAKKHYGIGRYFKGMVTRDAQGLLIGSNQGCGAQMTHLQEKTNISLITTTKLEREDIFKIWILKRYDATDNLWITPDIDLKTLWDRNQIQFLYLASAENYYSYKGKIMHSKLSFESLNDKLADTGYSVVNYIQLALMGGGYAWPRLRLKKDYNPDYPIHNQVEVFVDPIRTIDVGVWGFQIQIDNTAIIHSLRLMGYPALWEPGEGDKDEDGNIRYNTGYVFAPRPLFPKYFLPAVNHPLNLQLKAEENLILVPGIQPVLDFYIDWKKQKETAYNEMVQSAFEGHLRTDYNAIEKQLGKDIYQVWKNVAYLFYGRNANPVLANWPDWLVDRLTVPLAEVATFRNGLLDLFRSVFSNIFSRKIPQFGNINEKISYVDLKAPTVSNILALNSFAHHDLITLPLGVNQTITTETLDVVEDATSRIPKYWGPGLFNSAIEGFHNLVFGKSPSGFKKGGVDNRLAYYGDSMVGLMSKEMYIFYSGPRKNSLNKKQHKGIIPFNVFQENSDDNLSQVVSAKSNSTVLNFKLTDIAEMGVYNIEDDNPKAGGYKTEIVSTVHIGQNPWYDQNECEGRPEYPKYDYQWKKSDTILVDKNLNTLLDPRDEEMIYRWGFDSDNRRLYVISEIALQAIGAGDIMVTGFAQDPTKYGVWTETVAIWEV